MSTSDKRGMVVFGTSKININRVFQSKIKSLGNYRLYFMCFYTIYINETWYMLKEANRKDVYLRLAVVFRMDTVLVQNGKARVRIVLYNYGTVKLKKHFLYTFNIPIHISL